MDTLNILNTQLNCELNTVTQYYVLSHIVNSWGYNKLSLYFIKERDEEYKHADILISRILELNNNKDELTNNITNLTTSKYKLTINNSLDNIKDIWLYLLTMEQNVINYLKDNIPIVESNKDFYSKDILETILYEEEEHLASIKKELNLLSSINKDNYYAKWI